MRPTLTSGEDARCKKEKRGKRISERTPVPRGSLMNEPMGNKCANNALDNYSYPGLWPKAQKRSRPTGGKKAVKNPAVRRAGADKQRNGRVDSF